MADQVKATTCKDCGQKFHASNRAIECSFCENMYCQKCSKVKQTVFNEIGKIEGIMFNCIHCRIAMPSISKVLAKIESMEERLVRVEKKNNPEVKINKETIGELVREEKEEDQERCSNNWVRL